MSLITLSFLTRYQNGIIPKIRNYVKSKDSNEKGSSVPTGTDLNNLNTVGVYYFADDTVASSIVNLPLALSGKLLVMDNGNGGIVQVYIPNQSPRMFQRVYWSNAWTAWTEYAPKTYVDSAISDEISPIKCTETTEGSYGITATVDSSGNVTYSWSIIE